MERKEFCRVEVKDADRGTVACVFATKNVVDKDGDVTLDGAFADGAPCAISSYGHTSWKGMPPVGRGHIRETSTEAIFEGRFFLDTTAGLDTFTVVKEMSAHDGPGQQWSYGLVDMVTEQGSFQNRKVRFIKKVTVPEVSPVLMGAGIDTRTLVAKSGVTFADHSSIVLDDVHAYLERAREIRELRGTKGLSAAANVSLTQLDDELKTLRSLLDPNDAVRAEYERFVIDQALANLKQWENR